MKNALKMVWKVSRMVTIGQYLQPSEAHHPVVRFVPPEEFEHWREVALEMGFDEAASGPFVRSSYHAKESFQRLAPPASGRTAGGCSAYSKS